MPQNKRHKQKFSSNRAVSAKQQGRVISGNNNGAKRSLTPHEEKRRRQQANQAIRKNKIASVLEVKRLGSAQGAPRIVGFLATNESANPQYIIQQVQTAMGDELTDGFVPTTRMCMEDKQRITFCCESSEDIQRALDVAKVSDIVVMCLDVSQGLQETLRELNRNIEFEDEEGDVATVATWYSKIGLCITDHTRELVSSINSQGSPTVLVVLQGLETYENPKARARCQKLHTRYFASVLCDDHKVVAPQTSDEYTALVRTIQSIKLRSLMWRDIRPYLVAEDKEYDAANRTMTISGFLRGSPVSANGLIHLTNHGTFQVGSVAYRSDPRPTRKDAAYPGTLHISTDETRHSLEATKPSDTVEEENLVTEADVAFAQEEENRRGNKIMVPEGVSEYQAAWYEFEGEPVFDDMDSEMQEAAVNRKREEDEEPDAFGNLDLVSRKTITDVDLMKASDVLRVEKMTDAERQEEIRQLKEMSEEEMWNSDMIDTPCHFPARQRFSKYRGMKSFQTGKWNVEENLPIEYGHIFKLQGFKGIRESAFRYQEAEAQATIGMYVTITILEVPGYVNDSCGDFLIASGLLRHEQRWSVLHFHVQRSTELDIPIKSKTPMLAHVGFRKFYCSPIYSDASVGDRTKFSRFFHEDEKFKIATFFGPISYSPCNVLFFKAPTLEEQAEEVPLQLATFGSTLPPNPDLLILKRVVLTGRISVIYRKVVVVKYMFFNEDDVNYFLPLDLYTRLGRRGKITKSVGSKGLFKCVFNDIVQQHDVVCMDLYKRVYPKWNTVPFSIGDVKMAAGRSVAASVLDDDDEGVIVNDDE